MIVKELKGENESAPFTVFLYREEKIEKDINNRFWGSFVYSRTCPFGGNSRKNEPHEKGAMCLYFGAVWCHVTLPAKVMTLYKTQDLLDNGPQFAHVCIFKQDWKSASVSAIPVTF